MSKKMKFWTSLGAAAMSGTLVAEAAALDFAKPVKAHFGKQMLLADSGGEAGESGGAASGEDRTDYLKDLAVLEAHMLAGVALFKAGEGDAARAQLRHLGDEAYKELEPAFAKLQVSGFAAELEAVARALESASPPAEIDRLMDSLHAEIGEVRGGAMTAGEAAKVIHLLIREAAEDFAKAIKDGHVVDAHEYQDAWGYVQSAKMVLADVPAAETAEHPGPLGEIAAELAKAETVFPDITGTAAITADPSQLAVAAARIELAASTIR